ncbi:hypothetical protein [Kitasatospora sp. NPDC093679]|uniref:hypothetical protein n=1 Tax=unclassified Kitasatospora TaxID=2633591 RepID=UPI0034313EF2
MAVLVQVDLPGATTEEYEAIHARLGREDGIFAGCLAHVAAVTGDGMRIIDLWDSEASMNRFSERMRELGLARPGGSWSAVPVHGYDLSPQG